MKNRGIEPLSSRAVIELDTYLKNQTADMSLVKAHGFITAVVSFPNLFMPSEWIPILVGELKNKQDKVQANIMVDNLITIYLQITDSLTSIDDFKFLLSPEHPELNLETAPCSYVQEWCRGYCLALIWNDEEWLNAEEHFVTQACTTFFKLTNTIKDHADPQQNDLIQHLPKLVKMLYIYWLGEQNNNFIQHLKNLRNEPCPCGSRKKYSFCCFLEVKESVMH